LLGSCVDRKCVCVPWPGSRALPTALVDAETRLFGSRAALAEALVRADFALTDVPCCAQLATLDQAIQGRTSDLSSSSHSSEPSPSWFCADLRADPLACGACDVQCDSDASCVRSTCSGLA
jgi:hypothetical protein